MQPKTPLHIKLLSDYSHFDLFAFKKYQSCNVRIPDTALIDKGFIK